MQIDQIIAVQTPKLGTQIGLSEWLLIDQKMVDDFARVTLDDQFIHVDPARAQAETPFGGTIAHGFLTLSLGSKFVIECLPEHPGQVMQVNYGFDRVRFLAPVKTGSHIRARFHLAELTRKSDTQLLQKMTMTVEIQGENTPALVADWLALAVFEAS